MGDILTYDTSSGDPQAGATGQALSELLSHTVTFWLNGVVHEQGDVDDDDDVDVQDFALVADRWVEMYAAQGFELFEGGHLAGRGNVPYSVYALYNGYLVEIFNRNSSVSSYFDFLEDFFDDLYAHLVAKGWTSLYAQHLTDEPIDAVSYDQLVDLCQTHMPGIDTIDAIHSWGQDPLNERL